MNKLVLVFLSSLIVFSAKIYAAQPLISYNYEVSPNPSLDGNFAVIWDVEPNNSEYVCGYFGIDVRDSSGSLYESNETSNCVRRGFAPQNYPPGEYSIWVTTYSIYDDDTDYFIEEDVSPEIKVTVLSGGGSGSSPDLTESFESGLGAWSNAGVEDWLRRSGSTPSGSTGPSSAAAGSYYVYLETSSGYAYYSGNTASLESSTFNLGSSASLEFNYHMYGSNMGVLSLEIYSGGQWHTLWSRSGQQHSSSSVGWSGASVSLSGYQGQVKLRFRGVASGGYRGDMAIDNIRYVIPNEVSYVYDALGRIIEVRRQGVLDEEYNYDDAGNRTSVSKH